jgi:diacylglycerol kinase family enzyme
MKSGAAAAETIHFGTDTGRSALLLYNRRSGAHLADGVRSTLAGVIKALSDGGWRGTAHPLGEATIAQLPQMLREHEAELLAVMGGDGSVRSVLPALLDANCALAVIPCGTMNLLAHDLHLPFEPERAAAVPGRGRLRSIDVAEVNGEYFACHALLGRSPYFTRLRERVRGQSFFPRVYLYASLFGREILRSWRSLFLVQREGRTLWLRAHTLVVSNNRYAEAMPGRFAKEKLDGGVLGLYAVSPEGGLSWLRLAARFVFGTWQSDETLWHREGRTFTIRSVARTTRLSLDGETLLMKGVLRFRILPRALKVYAPAD